MKTSRTWLNSLLLASVCVATSFTACSPKATTAELTEAIVQAKSLSGEPKITLSGSEATVVTYKPANSVEKDLKIDAVMTAKALFDKDPELTKVILRFHDPRIAASYSEVPVTVADVGAFGAGAISKDQLLKVMPLVEHGTAGSAKPAPMSRQIAPVTGTVPGHFVNPTYGVQFDYPVRWTADYHTDGNALLRLFLPGARSRSMIELRVYPLTIKPSAQLSINPEDLFLPVWTAAFSDTVPETKRFTSLNPLLLKTMFKVTMTPVKVPRMIGIGPSQSVKAQQVAFYGKAKLSDRHYMRCVVVSGKRFTYQFSLLTGDENASLTSNDFDEVLKSTKLQ